ncbi:MAG: helix-turn-helix domain-containing protein [Actinomycetota bacterium]
MSQPCEFERMKADFLARHPEAAETWDAEIEALREEEGRFQFTLSQLRKARQMTQTEVAAVLGVTQPVISELEHRTDLYLRTLQNYIHAIGGELRLVATFSGEEFELDLADVAGETETRPAPEAATVAVPDAAAA